MRNFVKTKFFATLVVVALVLTIVPSVLYAMGVGNAARDLVNTVLSPFTRGFAYITDALDGFSSYFTEFDHVVEENKQLKEHIAELEDKVYRAEATEGMNEWLYDYLELRREHTDFSFEAATITGGGSNYMDVFIIDRGTSHNVQVDMPVITNEGVVGYVVEAGNDWSKVVTMLESSYAVGAYVERSGELGVVEGDYELAREGLCVMKYLKADSDIQVGDRILTSGFGSVYPRGLTVGYVEKIETDNNNRSIIAYIRPAASVDDLSRVMVITDYESYSE